MPPAGMGQPGNFRPGPGAGRPGGMGPGPGMMPGSLPASDGSLQGFPPPNQPQPPPAGQMGQFRPNRMPMGQQQVPSQFGPGSGPPLGGQLGGFPACLSNGPLGNLDPGRMPGPQDVQAPDTFALPPPSSPSTSKVRFWQFF